MHIDIKQKNGTTNVALLHMGVVLSIYVYIQTNVGHHTKEGVLNSIVSVPIQNWMSVVMSVKVDTLKLLVHVSKVG